MTSGALLFKISEHAAGDGAPKVHETAADRRAMPTFAEVAEAAGEKYGVCVRPLIMETFDTLTGVMSHQAIPCKATVASKCAPCAKKAKALRIQQCREGWHLDHEPADEEPDVTESQTQLLELRADLFTVYQDAKADGDIDQMRATAAEVAWVDEQLAKMGVRGTLPPLEPRKKVTHRSTKRRQDAPGLPRFKVEKRTLGAEYAGKYRPSLFVTFTLPSYGPVRSSAPVDHENYDYRSAARDCVHFASLVDRFMQNLRRAIGWDVQYFATVEPQKRGAPHLHVALRGSIPRKLVQHVAAATYHQVWWPHHEHQKYPLDARQPAWDDGRGTFIDPRTKRRLTSWDDAQEQIADDEDAAPAHVARFGAQVDVKGVLGGTPEADRHIGYLTKYLTKAVSEVLDSETADVRLAAHYRRLHKELQVTPCSDRCPVWLAYGIVPKGVTGKTVPGQCKGRAHRRDTLGMPGRRVLCSRKWTGKTLPDHKQDRRGFVQQLLTDAGVIAPDRDTGTLLMSPARPGDLHTPPREHLIMASIAQRTTWRNEYEQAMDGAKPPDQQQDSNSSVRSVA